MPGPLDVRLYLVTDRGLCGGRPLEEVLAAAVRGGVTAVQIREKAAPTREFVELVRRAAAIVRPAGVALLVNDRVDVALAAGADGVHLGRSDMAFGDARRLLGPGAFVGLSVETEDQAAEAAPWDVAYLAASPVFPTPTKTDTGPAWGLDGLARLRRATRHPIVAIGGLNEDNAAAALEAGADGIAIVSAVCAAPDPEAAARRLRRIVDLRRSGGRP